MKTMSYRTEGRIGYLTLNRPASYNAVDEPMATELHQFWNERRQDDTVGVIILDGGEAKGFCAGLDMRSDGNILPPPLMTVQKQVLRECELAVVLVSPSDNPPVRYNGRVWIRVGPRLAVATAEEERRLAERRRASDLPFDCRPVADATLNDLDLMFFQRDYLPSAVAPDALEQNQRPLDQQLASLRFLTPTGLPNYAAILVFGYDPQRWLPGLVVVRSIR